MGSKKAEIASEQRYFDNARHHRERARAETKDLPSAAAHSGVTAHLRKHADDRRRDLGGPDDSVAFGRIDHEDGDALYIGKHLIRDDSEVLVVGWRAPAAAAFYRASLTDPCGLIRKRNFECEGNTIQDFADVLFLAQSPDGPAEPDEDLLRELSRSRAGGMRDIVSTIRAAQFELMSAPLDQMLIIDGGPGTGKTAVALHRVSWLLFNHRERLTATDILMVGPHPAFTRYISTVLPGLGDDDVTQLDITRLAPTVRQGRMEPPDVARIKGGARMAGLIARAVDARIGVAEHAERLLIEGRFVTLPGTEITEAVNALRYHDSPYAQRRHLFRDRIAQLAIDRGAPPNAARQSSVENLVERIWPALSAASFLRDLLASRDRLLVAAGDEFTAAEVAKLRRRGADRLSAEIWSRDDLPLLDEAEHLLNGTDRSFRHIVVDEAQDLSPMQLRTIARRSETGSMTVVGDLAQSTGAWARHHWSQVIEHLPSSLPTSVARLTFGYRVPRLIYEFAAALLPIAAPGSSPPVVVRDGPATPPTIHRISHAERAGRVAAVAIAHRDRQRVVGVVAPEALVPDVEAALAGAGATWTSTQRGELGPSINIVDPTHAKGLEFDSVVVVEPEEIVANDEQGHRLLYVALTRTTGYLDVVCVGDPLPREPARPRTIVVHDESAAPVPQVNAVDVANLAAELATRVRGRIPPAQWEEVLAQTARRLVNREE